MYACMLSNFRLTRELFSKILCPHGGSALAAREKDQVTVASVARGV